MKKKVTCFVCIGIAVLLLISAILYFKPLSLSNVIDKNTKMYITLMEYNMETGETNSDTIEITDERQKEILAVLDEYTYQRTFGTLFYNGTMSRLGSKVLYIGNNGKTITVTETGKLSFDSKIYRINNAEQLIQQILEIVD